MRAPAATGKNRAASSSHDGLRVVPVAKRRALRYASVLRAIAALTGEPIAGLHIVGGGSRNDYLNQTTATATGREVAAGPSEATVIGNAVVQAVAQGRFPTLRAARGCVAGHVALKTFTPRPSPAFEAMAARYAAIEAQYSPA